MLNKLFNAFGRKEPHSRIVFERTGETISGLPKGIFTISPDGNDCRQIRASGESPRWSPDGRWIAFVEQTKDNGWLYSVFVMRPDGQNAQRLTFHHDVTATPGAWAPDSKHLAYSLWLWQDKKYQLCIVEVETGRWKHVFYSDDEIYPVWSPSDRIVFRQFGKSGESRLFEVNPDGQGFQPCPMFESGDDEPVWMWDGSRLVCGSNEGMMVMNGNGSGRHIIRSPRGAIQWAMSPDGESVVYSSSRETSKAGFELFIVDLKDESKRMLVANPMKGDKEVDSRCVSWSPWL